MNSVVYTNPLFAPHLHENPQHTPPPTSISSRTDLYSTNTMSGRKRKAESAEPDDRMSTSPMSSPLTSNRILPSSTSNPDSRQNLLQPRKKRSRIISHTLSSSKPLELPRLLETLSPNDLRSLITSISTQHPQLVPEIVSLAPRPTPESTLAVLLRYQSEFKASFPFGNRPTSDYTYNRVRQPLYALLEALKDYTHFFLPPRESQVVVSLNYLDRVTDIVHDLPEWDSFAHNSDKIDAYEELNCAWTLVVKEAMKRGGGIQLRFGEWDQKIVKHDNLSGGRLNGAVMELRKGSTLNYINNNADEQQDMMRSRDEERLRIRQQLLSGTFGADVSVGDGQGRW